MVQSGETNVQAKPWPQAFGFGALIATGYILGIEIYYVANRQAINMNLIAFGFPLLTTLFAVKSRVRSILTGRGTSK